LAFPGTLKGGTILMELERGTLDFGFMSNTICPAPVNHHDDPFMCRSAEILMHISL